MKKKQSFSWEGLGVLVGILLFPFMVIGEVLKSKYISGRRRN